MSLASAKRTAERMIKRHGMDFIRLLDNMTFRAEFADHFTKLLTSNSIPIQAGDVVEANNIKYLIESKHDNGAYLESTINRITHTASLGRYFAPTLDDFGYEIGGGTEIIADPVYLVSKPRSLVADSNTPVTSFPEITRIFVTTDTITIHVNDLLTTPKENFKVLAVSIIAPGLQEIRAVLYVG